MLRIEVINGRSMTRFHAIRVGRTVDEDVCSWNGRCLIMPCFAMYLKTVCCWPLGMKVIPSISLVALSHDNLLVIPPYMSLVMSLIRF